MVEQKINRCNKPGSTNHAHRSCDGCRDSSISGRFCAGPLRLRIVTKYPSKPEQLYQTNPNSSTQGLAEGTGLGPGPSGAWGPGLQNHTKTAWCLNMLRTSWWSRRWVGRWGPPRNAAPTPSPQPFLAVREKRRRFAPTPSTEPSNPSPTVGGHWNPKPATLNFSKPCRRTMVLFP